ncbi:MAG: mercuric transporter MerT family protein [Ghiorsea sp.]|nr:mercuric transporter MerT family protein [Ghiorsea sp.]
MTDLPRANHKSSLFAAILAGSLASACCIGPFVFVALGVGSASVFMVFEPFRPLFMMVTIGLLVWAAWQYWQVRKTCAHQGCIPPKPTLLWLLGTIAVFFLFFPSLLPLLSRMVVNHA